eukprot:GABU01005239.1.p1 GENE.GABU01005239.1~~GABU01005239.1.p1  ORF type:complete len:216 (-),score=44.28 GABU01005239.1:689-1336(-)
MLQKVNEITNDLNDVKLRNSIDMRYFSKYVDLQYLVLCDYAEFKKVATEVHKQNVPKLSNIAQSVSYDQSWIRIQEELVKLRNAAVQPPAEGGEAAPAPKAVTVADLAAHLDGPASTFQKDKLAGLFEVLHNTSATASMSNRSLRSCKDWRSRLPSTSPPTPESPSRVRRRRSTHSSSALKQGLGAKLWLMSNANSRKLRKPSVTTSRKVPRSRS